MPIFHLTPVVTMLDQAAWQNSPYRGEVWANARDEAEARGLVSGRYEDAGANIPGVSRGPSPWQDAQLVAVEEVAEGPNGMAIPDGVVVADRQM